MTAAIQPHEILMDELPVAIDGTAERLRVESIVVLFAVFEATAAIVLTLFKQYIYAFRQSVYDRYGLVRCSIGSI